MYSVFEDSAPLAPTVLYFCKFDLTFNKLFSEVSGFVGLISHLDLYLWLLYVTATPFKTGGLK